MVKYPESIKLCFAIDSISIKLARYCVTCKEVFKTKK